VWGRTKKGRKFWTQKGKQIKGDGGGGEDYKGKLWTQNGRPD